MQIKKDAHDCPNPIIKVNFICGQAYVGGAIVVVAVLLVIAIIKNCSFLFHGDQVVFISLMSNSSTYK